MLHKWEKWLKKNYDSDFTAKKPEKLAKNTKSLRRNKAVETFKKSTEWSDSLFPESNILIDIKMKNRDPAVLYERYSTMEILDVNEIVDTLHQIDLKLYRKVLPTELVKYGKKTETKFIDDKKTHETESKGSKNTLPKHFHHILLKNKALTRLTIFKLKNGMKISFFERICKKLHQKGNYNSLFAILNGIKTVDDTFTEFDDLNLSETRLDHPKEIEKLFILPFETILTDIAISNQDPLSEEANMFFYGIVKFFIQLQEKPEEMDDFLEHSIFKEMIATIHDEKELKGRKIKKGCVKFI